jgi:hypothetical protein
MLSCKRYANNKITPRQEGSDKALCSLSKLNAPYKHYIIVSFIVDDNISLSYSPNRYSLPSKVARDYTNIEKDLAEVTFLCKGIIIPLTYY